MSQMESFQKKNGKPSDICKLKRSQRTGTAQGVSATNSKYFKNTYQNEEWDGFSLRITFFCVFCSMRVWIRTRILQGEPRSNRGAKRRNNNNNNKKNKAKTTGPLLSRLKVFYKSATLVFLLISKCDCPFQ